MEFQIQAKVVPKKGPDKRQNVCYSRLKQVYLQFLITTGNSNFHGVSARKLTGKSSHTSKNNFLSFRFFHWPSDTRNNATLDLFLI